jgi:alpha-glucosidase
MVYRQIFVSFLMVISIEAFGQRSFTLDSPSGEIRVAIRVTDSIYFSVAIDKRETISESAIALLTTASKLGIGSRVRTSRRRSVRETIVNPVPFKRKVIPDHYNELTLVFRTGFSLLFRAYDDGVAYRFITAFKDSAEIIDEIATFNFQAPDTVYFSDVVKREGADVFHTSFEEPYSKLWLEAIAPAQVSYSPLLLDGNLKIIITESDLFDYPGMFLRGTNGRKLRGVFAPYPATEQIQGSEFRQPVVVQRRGYLARTNGSRAFPWRVLVIAKTDADLILNDLVYRLGSPPRKTDWSWVKPGISTEEWICGINLYGVDFKAGINTATYKYYIDFASKFGMQYVMLDAGWSDYNDLLKITPGLDLREIARYAKSKSISLILWTLSMTLERQLEEALTMFNSLGVKVIMTDFMDRDDQKTLRFYKRVAEATAEHRIMLMFHGAFKNAGFERTYPHAITREAVLGSEYNIWSDKATPEHDVLLPFIRMVAGPMDYEPGFYVNVNKETFRPLANHVMSQGTRCHQLAMFVVYDSPLQMFSGNPSDALQEPEYTSFLLSMPTTWDETKVIDAKLGEYVIVARKNGNDWYLGGMTDWTAREMEVDLSFLESGSFTVSICEDGINARKYSSDYSMREEKVDKSKTLKIAMAPGGGFAAKIIRNSGGRQ